MIPKSRYLLKDIKSDLKEKMVFVGGPRQVGKTTMALQCLKPKSARESHPAYLNWDILAHRDRIIRGQLPSKQNIIIFDEIHKYAEWRNLIKGHYDKNKTKISFLVTGSARLDHYRKGGDSLVGRYHYYRLHPFTLREMNKKPTNVDLKQLIKFGGFPEPLFKSDTRFHRRWQREHTSRILYEDLTSLERVQEVSKIELLLVHLEECVGSPLSINSFSKLLNVSHEAVSNWLTILENLYVIFRIPPYGHKKIRAVKKENKLYFMDWSRLKDPGAKFENLVACHLLKYCHFIEDTQGYEMELRYIRDTDKREVDFVVLKDNKPEFAIECKYGEQKASPHCSYFAERTEVKNIFQVHTGTKDYTTGCIRVLPFIKLCEELNLP